MMRFPPKSNTQNKESQISDHTNVYLPYGFPDQSNELWETKTKIKFPWEHRRNIFMLYMHTYNCNMGYRFTSIPLPLENYWLHKQATKIKREKTNKKLKDAICLYRETAVQEYTEGVPSTGTLESGPEVQLHSWVGEGGAAMHWFNPGSALYFCLLVQVGKIKSIPWMKMGMYRTHMHELLAMHVKNI